MEVVTHPKDKMKQFFSHFSTPAGFLAVFLVALVAGCGGGGLDPILGAPLASVAPTVSATLPVASTPPVTGVPINSRVSVTFSKPMAGATLTPASFTLACPAGAPVAASVAYDATSQTATLTPTAALPASTLWVATVTTAATDVSGLALAGNFVWSFMTGATADATRPTVVVTVPAPGAVNVATNTRITASFSEDMTPTSISGTSFTLVNTSLGQAVTGSVSYSVAARTATFTPTAPAVLAVNSVFTATITTAATDLAGNALAGNTAVLPNAGNHVWTFTTGATADSAAPTVTATSPQVGSVNVCLTRIVSVTFSEPMDVATLNATTFGVTDNGAPVAGTVTYDAPSRVASFQPANAAGFAANRTFAVTVRSGASGVKDLAGNPLAADLVFGFTTGTQPCLGPVNLGAAASFGSFGGGAGITNQGINTVVNGNLGTTAACTLFTGFHDATNVYTETPLNIGAVNGSIFCAPPAPGTLATLAIATQARADALTAFNALAALPPGSDPGAGQLGGLTLPAAVYTAAGGTFNITTGDLTLDAQGNANAVWVFQSAAALTVGLPAIPRRVFLINGAQAKNVFWQVGSAARIEDRSTMVGTIIAPAGVTISTAGQLAQTTLIGRAIGLTASVTMVNTTIVAP